MIWVNGENNSGLANFILESRLPYCTNQFHLTFSALQLIKMLRLSNMCPLYVKRETITRYEKVWQTDVY